MRIPQAPKTRRCTASGSTNSLPSSQVQPVSWTLDAEPGCPPRAYWWTAASTVTGLDISAVQIERARRLVPRANFVHADMATWDCEPDTYQAIVTLYALIHVPLEDQRLLFPRMAQWLRPGGYLLAIVGHDPWTGIEDYMGAPMFWDHADNLTYLAWLR